MRWAMIVCAALLAGCGSSINSGGGGGSDYTKDPASLLASDDGSSEVGAYATALDAWQTKCTESRVTIAGYVDTAYRDEQDHGGVADDTSRLDVMRHLTASVPDVAAPTRCQDIAATYLVLVERGP